MYEIAPIAIYALTKTVPNLSQYFLFILFDWVNTHLSYFLFSGVLFYEYNTPDNYTAQENSI